MALRSRFHFGLPEICCYPDYPGRLACKARHSRGRPLCFAGPRPTGGRRRSQSNSLCRSAHLYRSGRCEGRRVGCTLHLLCLRANTSRAMIRPPQLAASSFFRIAAAMSLIVHLATFRWAAKIGRYWGNSGHCRIFGRTGNDANEPTPSGSRHPAIDQSSQSYLSVLAEFLFVKLLGWNEILHGALLP